MSVYNEALLCNNFLGIKRVNSSFSSSGISASDLQNVELFDTGTNSGTGIRTMKGNTEIYAFDNPNEKIINVFESVQNANKYCFIYTETQQEGKIYLYNELNNTVTLKTDGLQPTGVCSGTDFAYGWSDLFLFSNGVDILSVELNAQSDEVIKFNPVDTEGNPVHGLGMVVFDGRLWIFDGVKLWYSQKENCYDFSTSSAGISTSAGYIEFVKGITAIYPYLGSLAVFHKDSSALITLNEDYTYSMSEESPGGCAGYNALVFHDTQLFFYDDTKKSVFTFSQVINGNKVLSENLARDVQDELFYANPGLGNKIRMLSVVQPEKNEVWFLIPSGDSSRSVILIFDYIHKQWLKRKSQKITSISIIRDKLYSSSGNKLLLEYSGKDFNGVFIPAFYTCSPLNLGVDNSVKVLYKPPRVTLDAEYHNEFWVKYDKNYDNVQRPLQKYIKLRTWDTLFYWDVSFWDINTVFKLSNLNTIKALPTSSFKTLQITFSTKVAGQAFSIKNIEFLSIKVKQA